MENLWGDKCDVTKITAGVLRIHLTTDRTVLQRLRRKEGEDQRPGMAVLIPGVHRPS